MVKNYNRLNYLSKWKVHHFGEEKNGQLIGSILEQCVYHIVYFIITSASSRKFSMQINRLKIKASLIDESKQPEKWHVARLLDSITFWINSGPNALSHFVKHFLLYLLF